MSNVSLAMHPDLPGWLREPNLIGDTYRKTLQSYKASIEALIQKDDPSYISDLASLACGAPATSVAHGDDIRKEFRSRDPAFVSNDAYLLQVLCGATLMTLLHQESDHQVAHHHTLAVTAVLSSSYAKTLKCEPPALLAECEAYIEAQGVARRKTQEVPNRIDARVVSREQRSLKTALTAQNVNPSDPDLSRRIIHLYSLFVEFAPTMTQLLENQNILREEADLAWWTLAGHSRTRNIPFEDLNPLEAPVILACELAERTRVLPTGQIAQHLLSRLLPSPTLSLSLVELIHAVDEAWIRGSLPEEPQYPGTTPVLYALYAKQHSGDRWRSHLQRHSTVDPDLNLCSRKLAYTIYQEYLTYRLQGHTKQVKASV